MRLPVALRRGGGWGPRRVGLACSALPPARPRRGTAPPRPGPGRRNFRRSKLHKATGTEANLEYVGLQATTLAIDAPSERQLRRAILCLDLGRYTPSDYLQWFRASSRGIVRTSPDEKR